MITASHNGAARTKTGERVLMTTHRIPSTILTLLVAAALPALGQTTSPLVPVLLDVDATGSGESSNLNRVLEPGETALVSPVWASFYDFTLGLSGILSELPTPTDQASDYAITDALASYGSVAPRAVASCEDTGDCYAVEVFDVGTGSQRGLLHWDVPLIEMMSNGAARSWLLHVGESFNDVHADDAFYAEIETVLHNGISYGYPDQTFRPNVHVVRSLAAIFFARALAGSDAAVPAAGQVPGRGAYSCSPGGSSVFADVSAVDPFCRHAHYLAARNLMRGCEQDLFCPGAQLNRGQYAVVLAKSIMGGAEIPTRFPYLPTPSDQIDIVYDCSLTTPKTHFADAPAGSAFCAAAHFLWATGVTQGCGPTAFCPSSTITRGQGSKLLVDGLGLTLY